MVTISPLSAFPNSLIPQIYLPFLSLQKRQGLHKKITKHNKIRYKRPPMETGQGKPIGGRDSSLSSPIGRSFGKQVWPLTCGHTNY